MKNTVLFSLTIALLMAGSVSADLCHFGYADAVVIDDQNPTVEWTNAQAAGVPQDSGRIIPLDDAVEAHTRDIRSYIQAMNNQSPKIRPLIDLTDVIWSPTATVNTGCGSDYERGSTRSMTALPRQNVKANWRSKLASFLNLNTSKLDPGSIRGFIVHIEINNSCIPNYVINTVALELSNLGYGPSNGYIVTGGYGLTHTTTGSTNIVSTGMPTNFFPFRLTHISAWAYDVQGLWTDSVYNLNDDVMQLGVAGFWNKLVGKLHPPQKVIWGFTGFCDTLQQQMFNGAHLTSQQQLGTQCSGGNLQYTWPIASIANHWRWFAESEPRMDGLIAIYWGGTNGTSHLDPVVTDNQELVGQSALTCD